MASSNLFFSLVFALSFVHLLAASAPVPAPTPSDSDYNAAPAPAPYDSDHNAALAPAPAPAPSDNDYNAAPAPAPNDNDYNAGPLEKCGFHAIYQLGDSMSDTGNLVREHPDVVFNRNPYGVSFFNKTATGRCSDGLLMIDFFAMSAGVPLLDAYWNPNVSSRSGHGMNFAVAGSTALPTDILAQNKILAQVTNSSLTKQLDWMFSYFNTTCSQDKECSEKIKKSLFIVEIGGNDYNYALFQSKTMEDLKTNLVPDVVQAIKDAVTRIIGLGATRMIVPGNFPIGCFPIYLTGFRTNDSTAYDESHYLKDLNNFAKYHNEHLKQAIQQLQKENRNVTIGYGDFYEAFQWILHQTNLIGFDATSVQKACCGIGGEYNFNRTKTCGAPGVPVCPNPDKYISFDGIHLTQKAYQYMSRWLINDIFPKLQCLTGL